MLPIILIVVIALAALALRLMLKGKEGFYNTAVSPTLCYSGLNFRKLGSFKLGYADMRADWLIAQPQYAADGWIFIGNPTDWTQATSGGALRNETYGAVLLTQNDINGQNVVDMMSPIAAAAGIPVYPSDNAPVSFTYLLTNQTSQSSLIIQNSGTISPANGRVSSIIGQYVGNNHGSTTDQIGPSVGAPVLNDTYDLYYALNTDKCASPTASQVAAAAAAAAAAQAQALAEAQAKALAVSGTAAAQSSTVPGGSNLKPISPVITSQPEALPKIFTLTTGMVVPKGYNCQCTSIVTPSQPTVRTIKVAFGMAVPKGFICQCTV
jgi:hypothetical protein